MNHIVIIDTSVLLHVFNIDGNERKSNEVLDEFIRLVERDEVDILLPLAVVLETSNKIKQMKNGRKWPTMQSFLKQVCDALDDSGFWFGGILFPDPDELSKIVCNPPTFGGKKLIDVNDSSIIRAWKSQRARHPYCRVRIWSFDSDLATYDYIPTLGNRYI